MLPGAGEIDEAEVDRFDFFFADERQTFFRGHLGLLGRNLGRDTSTTYFFGSGFQAACGVAKPATPQAANSRSNRLSAAFAGADAHAIFQGQDEDFSIADASRVARTCGM